jgi:hypothetical protein
MKKQKPIDRARMYALDKGVTDRTARKHLQGGYQWDQWEQNLLTFNRAAAIANVLRDYLPKGLSFWAPEGFWRNRNNEIVVVIDDLVYDEFLHESYDALSTAVCDAGACGVQLTRLSEVEAEYHPQSGCWIKPDSSGMTSIEMYLLERDDDDDDQSISAST